MSEKHSLEVNKIAASILLAGVIAMVSGFIADGLYTPTEAEKRGYSVEVAEETAGGAEAVAEIDVGTLLASADAGKGGDAAGKKCTSCHTFEQGGANKVGPNLYGIMGADFAHADGFAYSEAMKNHGGKWGYDEMNQWLKNPSKYIKGNKMAYAGVKNDEERANIIMYLKSISPSAPPIPAPAPAAEPATPADDTSKAPETGNASDSAKNIGEKIDASKDVKNAEANKARESGKPEALKGPAAHAIEAESKKAADTTTQTEKNAE